MKRTILALLPLLFVAACQPGEAEKFLAELELKPAMNQTAAAALEEADASLGANEYVKAKAGYEVVLGQYPDNLDALEGAALSEMNLGDFTSAVSKFNKVLAKRPNSWRSLNAIAVLHTLKGQLPQAGEFFIAADKASPNNPAILNNWGLGYAISGNALESVKRLDAAVAAAKDDAVKRRQVEMNLAMVQALNQQDVIALEILRRNLPEAEALNNLAIYASMRGDEAASQNYLKQALAGRLPTPQPVIPQPAGLEAITLPPMMR